MLGEDGDGLATDSAPSFEGMRLSEVCEMASAMGVTLAEHDGNFNGVAENSERRILQASNWYVKRQFPAPGTQLERMRRVRVWVLKHGENDLSHRQSLAYLKAIGQG